MFGILTGLVLDVDALIALDVRNDDASLLSFFLLHMSILADDGGDVTVAMT
ncbi:hypothetical protein DPMN_110781 [Dreissena polymorpha]|uniref:Uncharacterized protein n=1 Tax=Dreissena polymorpha TaxID=45954 RepID=A0A9D4QP59_DREPO|nr:hypothetical protein DPMN_110781 [Dreissena polymorpha]